MLTKLRDSLPYNLNEKRKNCFQDLKCAGEKVHAAEGYAAEKLKSIFIILAIDR